MYRVLPLLSASEIAECRKIAAATPFVDGRITNPHNKAKNNQQLHDRGAYEESSQLLLKAFARSEEFQNFAFPAAIAPPLITRYQSGMQYGPHADVAFMQVAGATIRSDLSCTIFLSEPDDYDGGALRIHLSEPDDYDGGALRIHLGDADIRFKLRPGEAILYPSDTLHEVEPVTEGERLVAITFVQSRLPDPFQRNLLFELNEVAALEGLKMSHENFTRLQLVRSNLLRYWGDRP
jgi:PKHD-type hydroxylase